MHFTANGKLTNKKILTHNKYTNKIYNQQDHSLKSKEKNTGESHDQPVSSQLNLTIEKPPRIVTANILKIFIYQKKVLFHSFVLDSP